MPIGARRRSRTKLRGPSPMPEPDAGCAVQDPAPRSKRALPGRCVGVGLETQTGQEVRNELKMRSPKLKASPKLQSVLAAAPLFSAPSLGGAMFGLELDH